MANISIANLHPADTESLLIPIGTKAENLISAAISRSLEARKVMGSGSPIGGHTIGYVDVGDGYPFNL
jgi:hypothetical protein